MSDGLRLRCDEGVLRIAAGAPGVVAAAGRARRGDERVLPGILDRLGCLAPSMMTIFLDWRNSLDDNRPMFPVAPGLREQKIGYSHNGNTATVHSTN